MNNFIIYSWNRVVTDDDIVIVTGKVGNGTLEEMSEVIKHLHGSLTLLTKKLNTNFSKEEWRKIGFKHIWSVPLFKEFENKDKAVYIIDPIENLNDYKDFKILAVDSSNYFDGLILSNMLSLDAAKWSYSPIDSDSLLEIYENMKLFEDLDIGEQHTTEIKEEWEQ